MGRFSSVESTCTPLGHETLTVSSTSIGLQNIPSGAKGAYVHTSSDIRIWLDGTAPTGALGYKKDAGTEFELTSMEELRGFRVCAVVESSILSVMYRD